MSFNLELCNFENAQISIAVEDADFIANFHRVGTGRKRVLAVRRVGLDFLMRQMEADLVTVHDLYLEWGQVDIHVFVSLVREDNHEIRGIAHHLEAYLGNVDTIDVDQGSFAAAIG